MKKIIAMCVSIGLACTVMSSANAASATGEFKVLITITSNCSVGATTDISFGPMSANKVGDTSGTGNIKVTCSKGTAYIIGLAPSSTNGGDNIGNGFMASVANGTTNSDKVPYKLTKTSGGPDAWGNTGVLATPGNGVTGVGTGTAKDHAVYATVSNYNFTPDNYTDTVTVNVTY